MIDAFYQQWLYMISNWKRDLNFVYVVEKFQAKWNNDNAK